MKAFFIILTAVLALWGLAIVLNDRNFRKLPDDDENF